MKTVKTAIEAIEYSKKNPNETVECKTYWDNGNLYEHIFYVNGLAHGEYKWYLSDGDIMFHLFYACGLYHGEYKEYDIDGKLSDHCFFANSEEINVDHLKDGSYKSLCIKHTLFNGNVIDEDI